MAGFQIKIPREIWNEYDQTVDDFTEPAPKATLNLQVTTATTRDSIEGGMLQSKHKWSKRLTHCKIKLWKFNYGGSSRNQKGVFQNDITYEQPCLQSTCGSCWAWHPHLLRILNRTNTDTNTFLEESQPPELCSSNIDPRILDGTWKHNLDRRNSAQIAAGLESATGGSYDTMPMLTSADEPLCQTPKPANGFSSQQAHSNFVSRRNSLGLSRAHSKGRCTARLAFASHNGKRKFKTLIRERQQMEMRRTNYQGRRLALEGAKKSERGVGRDKTDGGIVKRSVRSRYRLRLLFGSEEGKLAFKRVVWSYVK